MPMFANVAASPCLTRRRTAIERRPGELTTPFRSLFELRCNICRLSVIRELICLGISSARDLRFDEAAARGHRRVKSAHDAVRARRRDGRNNETIAAAHESVAGPSRQFAATQQFCPFRGMADIAEPTAASIRSRMTRSRHFSLRPDYRCRHLLAVLTMQ
jgi:hypothetical protein